MNTPDSALGFGHFIAQSDVVGKTLLVILVLMSVVSWAIIALKGLTLVARKRRSESEDANESVGLHAHTFIGY